MASLQPTDIDNVPGVASNTMERAQGCITAQELKSVLMDVLLAASGCMKSRPGMAERGRLRLALGRALKAHKSAVHLVQETSRPLNMGPPPDPVRWVTDYVEQGGNWQDLIAAITSRGITGLTRQKYLNQHPRGSEPRERGNSSSRKAIVPPSLKKTKGKDHDKRIQH